MCLEKFIHDITTEKNGKVHWTCASPKVSSTKGLAMTAGLFEETPTKEG